MQFPLLPCKVAINNYNGISVLCNVYNFRSVIFDAGSALISTKSWLIDYNSVIFCKSVIFSKHILSYRANDVFLNVK